MATFKIGDQVEVLDEDISGQISGIEGTRITITTADGFPMEYSAKELVKVSDGIRITSYEIEKIKKEKELPKKKLGNAPKPKERNLPKMEVDLHINQLVPSTKGLSNFDMLNLQLETAKRQLDFAIKKRIQKVVFIHGIGEGILKEELHYLFNRYDNLKFYDADYQKYGLGATEVYIFQNS
ncbi:Smr/MutS family protein [Flagellimonas sp. HMM57]|uniref:Smr/MutS family protein n=1 Tax=unclassified Flagellimonas TaxID=2644544 RepID=UPI0013D6CBB5|nr:MULTISPECIES: Smr/MutS family protein [unclassified Flagellimonas]UII75243.1 Smr/MutS family protein [Flagellimonas sp. HMM57]